MLTGKLFPVRDNAIPHIIYDILGDFTVPETIAIEHTARGARGYFRGVLDATAMYHRLKREYCEYAQVSLSVHPNTAGSKDCDDIITVDVQLWKANGCKLCSE